MYSLLLYEWWVPLIKFIIRSTIHVREWTTDYAFKIGPTIPGVPNNFPNTMAQCVFLLHQSHKPQYNTNHANHNTVQNSHSSTTLADLQQNPLHPKLLSSHWWAWMNKLKNLYSSKLRECHCRRTSRRQNNFILVLRIAIDNINRGIDIIFIC